MSEYQVSAAAQCSIACDIVGLRNRIIATYGCWAVAALGTTMTWATRSTGAKFSGQTGGLNGRMVLVLALAPRA